MIANARLLILLIIVVVGLFFVFVFFSHACVLVVTAIDFIRNLWGNEEAGEGIKAIRSHYGLH